MDFKLPHTFSDDHKVISFPFLAGDWKKPKTNKQQNTKFQG